MQKSKLHIKVQNVFSAFGGIPPDILSDKWGRIFKFWFIILIFDFWYLNLQWSHRESNPEFSVANAMLSRLTMAPVGYYNLSQFLLVSNKKGGGPCCYATGTIPKLSLFLFGLLLLSQNRLPCPSEAGLRLDVPPRSWRQAETRQTLPARLHDILFKDKSPHI